MNIIKNGHIVRAPGEGEVLEAHGNRIVIKVADASQTVCEYIAPPNFPGPPLHVHPGFDETFLVLDGRIEITVEDDIIELTPGATAYVRGNVPHTFRNPARDPARLLLICSPGGFEHYFRAIAADDDQTLAAISERFGYRPVDASPRA
jgi:mannose-6-phosphate isomerase-like protein (cupin superfamily)